MSSKTRSPLTSPAKNAVSCHSHIDLKKLILEVESRIVLDSTWLGLNWKRGFGEMLVVKYITVRQEEYSQVICCTA